MVLLLFVMVSNLGLNVELTAFLRLIHFHPKALGWGWNSAQVFQGAAPVSWPWTLLPVPARGCSRSWGPEPNWF